MFTFNKYCFKNNYLNIETIFFKVIFVIFVKYLFFAGAGLGKLSIFTLQVSHGKILF